MGTYSIGALGRRELLLMSTVLAVGATRAAAATPPQPTPDQARGPFFRTKPR
jgi:hypothetical protein